MAGKALSKNQLNTFTHIFSKSTKNSQCQWIGDKLPLHFLRHRITFFNTNKGVSWE